MLPHLKLQVLYLAYHRLDLLLGLAAHTVDFLFCLQLELVHLEVLLALEAE